ncbi:MAG: alpha-E domain-containing protein [Saprospiraceae bacterium]|nr:alpha-E domain-containing protein [Saprospiraceae bacterium]
MLSRTAKSIYWMSRYVERAENYARFIDVNYNLSLEIGPGVPEQWKPLILATGDWDLYQEHFQSVTKSDVIYFLSFHKENPNSIKNCLIKARENARQIRPEITKELWEQINALYYYITDENQIKILLEEEPRNLFAEIKKGCQLLYGIFDATVSRNEGWNFRTIGQYIERADKTLRVLDVKYHILLPSTKAVGSTVDLVQWASLLKSVSAYDMYRKKNGTLNTRSIVDFLLFDRHFARSVFYCLIEAQVALHEISGNRTGYVNEAERRLGALKSMLEFTNIDAVLTRGLHEFIDDLQRDINSVSDAVQETFFFG